ncbi:MAG TPA: GNAT family protein [Candidatus Limnocylindrales bacterium]|nr:GNAT family protein [Candidatus Limnocylindrales bacterium]
MTDRPPLRPVIRAERVYLRPIEPADAEIVHRWYEDAEFLALMGGRPASLAERRAAFERRAADPPRDVINLAVCLRADGRPIGRVDVFEIDPYNGNAGFGIGIGDADDRGQGFGREAVRALCDYAFGQLRLERLWLTTDADNVIAQHLYESIGFRREGVARHAYYQDGRYQDDVRMAILRAEWLASARPKVGLRIDPMEPEPL